VCAVQMHGVPPGLRGTRDAIRGVRRLKESHEGREGDAVAPTRTIHFSYPNVSDVRGSHNDE
jgi:hypothetical protein